LANRSGKNAGEAFLRALGVARKSVGIPFPLADRIEAVRETRGSVDTFDETALAALDLGLAILEAKDWRELMRLAASHDGRGEYAAARAIYQRALERCSDPVVVHTQIAETWRKAEEYESALPIYELALAAAPDNLYALSGKAESLRMLGRLDEALLLFERAVELGPRHPFALQGLAATLAQCGAHTHAIELYERALELEDNAFAHDGLATSRAALAGAVSLSEAATGAGALSLPDADGS
jgi:tetratricopeptide (TPR) repeat protein